MSESPTDKSVDDSRSGQKIFIVILDVAVLLFIFAIANYDLVDVHFWPWGPMKIPVFVLLGAGFAAGVLTTVLLYRIKGRPAQSSWIYLVLFCAAVMASAAARTDQLSFTQALLIIIFGSVALIAAAYALSLLRDGETIELQSNWGGLGGGLGGWRLSPATSLVVLSLLFTASATLTPRLGADDKPKESKEATDAKKLAEAKKAAEAKDAKDKKDKDAK